MLKIYDSSLNLQAILSEEEYWDDIIEESINKEYYLTFTTIIDSDKSEYIANDNIIEADGNYFQIVYFQKQRTSSGELLIQVEAWQVAMDLNDPAYNLDTFTEDDTPTNIMTAILSGTGFTVGTVDFVTQTTFSIQEKSSRRSILIQFAEILGGELKFDKYSISLLTQRGADNGVQFRVGKNLLGITKHVDKRSGTLKTAYDVDMVELRTLSEFGDLEAVELGDTVKIIDSDVGANEKQRIVTYAYSPKLRISSRVVIANHLDGIEDSLFRIERTTVVKEKIYNGIKIGPEDGFEAIRSDNKARTIMNATEGIKIQQGDGTGDTWDNVIYLDVNGNAVFEGTVQASDFVGGTINIGTGAFTVDNTGNVAITTGSINLGSGAFTVDNTGNIAITTGSINLGSGVFTVDNAGNMVATSGTFGGTLDAVDGTFTGTLSAVDGTFTGALIGGTIAIGSGNNIFKADSNGIYLGNAVFGSAPFSVSMTGNMTATSATITGTISSSIITGSTIIGGAIKTASTGARIELSNNSLKTYNASNNLNGFAWGTDVGGTHYGDAFLYHNGIKLVEFYDDTSFYRIRPTAGKTMVLGGSTTGIGCEGTWQFELGGSLNVNATFTVFGGSSFNTITQSNSTAANTAEIVADFNTLLSNLRSLNILAA